MTRTTIAGRAWHLFLQVLLWHRKPPSLRLTDAARDQLLFHLSNITDFEPVAALLWGSDVTGGITREPRWGIGFYNLGTRPYGRVTRIQGVPFVFTQNRAYMRLNGATLDYRNGRFVVDERSGTQ